MWFAPHTIQYIKDMSTWAHEEEKERVKENDEQTRYFKRGKSLNSSEDSLTRSETDDNFGYTEQD